MVAVAEFIGDDEVHAGQVVGKPDLPGAAGLGLESVDNIDHAVERAVGAGSNAHLGTGGPGYRPSKWPVPGSSRCYGENPGRLLTVRAVTSSLLSNEGKIVVRVGESSPMRWRLMA